MLSNTPTNAVIFLFAHQDDEFFVLPRIQREVAARNEVWCFYTTDGCAYGAASSTRLAESQRVLQTAGVDPEKVISLGTEWRIPDGSSHLHFERLSRLFNERFGCANPVRIYTMAWEGGHVDHDVVHLLGLALHRSFPTAPLFEFSAYNGYRMPGPFFRCLALIPCQVAKADFDIDAVIVDVLSFRQAFWWFSSAFSYHTQRKTFLGLLPFCLERILFRRRLICRRVPPYNYETPPHQGALLYEKRFKVPFLEFLKVTQTQKEAR